MADQYVTGYTVHQPAWHGKDVNVDSYPENWDDALALAGIDWDIAMAQAYIEQGNNIVPVPNRNFIVNANSGKILSGDTVGDTYHAIPLRGEDGMGKIIEMVFDVADSENWGIKLETLQSLKDNKVVVGTIRLDEPWNVDGDSSARYDFFVLRNSWDRSAAFTLGPNSVRVVCANTDLAAQRIWENNSLGVSLKHTSGFKTRVNDVRDAVRAARASQHKTRAFLNRIAHRPVSSTEAEEFLNIVYPLLDVNGKPLGDVAMRNQLARREQVRKIRASETVDGAGVAGNLYGMVMSVTEWADHYRPADTRDTRIERVLFMGDEYKARAFKAAKELVAV